MEVHARATDAGVGQVVVVATDLTTTERAIALSERFPRWHATAGVHPHDSDGFDDATADHLRSLGRHPHVVAIGETGLDFHRRRQTIDVQQWAFEAQCRIALEIGLPIVIHSRESLDAIAGVLTRFPGLSGVMHSFTGGPDEAIQFLDLGLHVSISGIATFRGADDVRATAAAIPDDRLMLETDAPYLSPAPVRGCRNEPAHLVHTASVVATARGISVPSLTSLTTYNARTLFGAIRPSG